jgi:hypothetical protein
MWPLPHPHLGDHRLHHGFALRQRSIPQGPLDISDELRELGGVRHTRPSSSGSGSIFLEGDTSSQHPARRFASQVVQPLVEMGDVVIVEDGRRVSRPPGPSSVSQPPTGASSAR